MDPVYIRTKKDGTEYIFPHTAILRLHKEGNATILEVSEGGSVTRAYKVQGGYTDVLISIHKRRENRDGFYLLDLYPA